MHQPGRSAARRAHDDLDRIVSGSGNAPEVGSRPMRRERARRSEDPRDCLFTCSRRSGQTQRQVRSAQADHHQWRGTTLRCSLLLERPSGGNKPVVVGGEEVELWVSPCPSWVQ